VFLQPFCWPACTYDRLRMTNRACASAAPSRLDVVPHGYSEPSRCLTPPAARSPLRVTCETRPGQRRHPPGGYSNALRLLGVVRVVARAKHLPPHSSLGGLTPAEYAKRSTINEAAPVQALDDSTASPRLFAGLQDSLTSKDGRLRWIPREGLRSSQARCSSREDDMGSEIWGTPVRPTDSPRESG
jgi:hypothetical protein